MRRIFSMCEKRCTYGSCRGHRERAKSKSSSVAGRRNFAELHEKLTADRHLGGIAIHGRTKARHRFCNRWYASRFEYPEFDRVVGTYGAGDTGTAAGADGKIGWDRNRTAPFCRFATGPTHYL